MRKLYLSIIIAIVYSTIIAQVPESFNYQAIPRDGGSVYPEQEMNVRISILSGGPSGSSVYTETFNSTTTSLGLLNLQVGKGAPTNVGDLDDLCVRLSRTFLCNELQSLRVHGDERLVQDKGQLNRDGNWGVPCHR